MALEIYSKPLEELSTLDQVIRVGRMAREEVDLDHAKELLKILVDEANAGNLGDLKAEGVNLASQIAQRIATIDKSLNDYSNEVLHHPEFQKLEASWRGFHRFLTRSEPSDLLKIRVLNMSKKELMSSFQGAMDFDQSFLFKRVYEDEYGTFGGTPFSVLVADYYFDKSPKDIYLLGQLSQVGSAAHAPVISGVSPELFGMDDFSELPEPRDFGKQFSTGEYMRWQSFREAEDSKYLALCLPRVLQREAYSQGNLECEMFPFEEEIVGTNHNNFLWGNSAYAFGLQITSAYNQFGWCAAIKGVEGGGLCDDLPVIEYTSSTGEKVIKCPTEILITDRREKELSDLGFVTLCYKKYSNFSVIFDCPSIAKVKVYEQPEANANAKVATQINYLLAASRFAHYIKVILRDKIGSFATQADIQSFLQNWLARYILLVDVASQETKSRYPLREASVEVSEDVGKPGCYSAVIFLRPHFQLNELTVSLRMVAQIPAGGAAEGTEGAA